MKKLLLTVFITILSMQLFAQVGINTTNPSPAAVLDVESSNDGTNFGGFLPPRVDATGRANITSKATATDDGLLIFFIDTRCLQMWNGVDSVWDDVYCIPQNAAPVATNVTYTGTLQEDETLTASFTYNDAEGDPAGAHIYTWYHADDASGTNQTQLQTGTSNSYTILTADIGSFIAVEVTPVASTGTSPGLPVLSLYDGPVIIASTFTPFTQDFDTNTNWNYTLSPTNYNTSGDVWDIVNTLTNITNVSGDFLGCQDLNNTNGGGNFFHEIQLATVNVGGGTNVRISFDYDVYEFDNGDDVRYEVFFDGVGQGVVLLVDGTSNLSVDGTETIVVPGTVTTVSLTVGISQNGGGDMAGFDNFRVYEL